MNLAEPLGHWARTDPDHPAVLFEGRAIGYGELDRQASRVAGALRTHGIAPGDRVAIYLPNLPEDHFYMDMYRNQKSIVVIGQGAWEEALLPSTRQLDTICRQKGIPTRFEYWGFDVNHDWPWWHKMVPTYLPWLLG